MGVCSIRINRHFEGRENVAVNPDGKFLQAG